MIGGSILIVVVLLLLVKIAVDKEK